MLGRPDRNQLGDRVDVKEIIADLFYFPELGLDMLGAQVADIKPKMIPVRTLHPKPLFNVMGHPTGNHVPGCQLCFFRLILVHEPLFIYIQQGTPVTTAAFCHQDICGNDTCGMKLNGLGVSQRDDLGVKGYNGAATFINHRVGGFPIDPAISSCGDQGGICQIDSESSCLQASGHCAHTGFPVMNE